MTFPRPFGVPSIEEPALPEVGVSGEERAPLVLSAARRTHIYEVFSAGPERYGPTLSCGVFSSVDNAQRYIDDQGPGLSYLITARELDVAGSRKPTA